MKQISAVEWLVEKLKENGVSFWQEEIEMIEEAKEMDKERMLDFGDFIIDELAPMAQNREWVEERYNYFKSE